MAANTRIEWARHTFNPWRGCVKISEACRNCYAERRSVRNHDVFGTWGPNGTRVMASGASWREPLKWDREARAAGERHRVFCASLADVFEEWDGIPQTHDGRPLYVATRYGAGREVGQIIRPGIEYNPDAGDRPATLDDLRRRLLTWLIPATPYLVWLILTKRPENVRPMLARLGIARLPANVWIGVSAEDRENWDRRIPELLTIEATCRFVSCEPLLGPIEASNLSKQRDAVARLGRPAFEGIDWVIAGGESGPFARPSHPDWFRSLRNQCVAAGVPFLFKQWGEWCPAIDMEADPERVEYVPLDWKDHRERYRCIRADGTEATGYDGRTADFVIRLGKSKAGRTLDGRLWDQVPDVGGVSV